MENYNVIHYLMVGLGLATFFVAIKPGTKLMKFRNLFWILGNVFFVAAFVIRYIDQDTISYTAIAMVLLANYQMVVLKNKKEE